MAEKMVLSEDEALELMAFLVTADTGVNDLEAGPQTDSGAKSG